jgi:glycosyltransferase involved in cell wall biosynthesis
VSDPHVLIIVQNLPVPLDRRVWLECQALVAAGYEVSVICPKAPGDSRYTVHEGVHLYKYRPPAQANGLAGYAWEFAYCWLRTAALSLSVWRRRRFAVLQACNPPDIYWLLARLWRLRGVRFVFDHHDLNPELFLARFGMPTSLNGRAQLAGLRWLERRTFRAADRVISTNGSYRRIARSRGGVPARRTAEVRSGPDTSTMRPVEAVEGLRRGGRHLVVYLGVMGPQDGVDGVLEVARLISQEHGRGDVRFALLGFGDCLEDLRQQCSTLGLDDVVHFTGRVCQPEIGEYLSTASIGLSPDPFSPLNDVSTMNKTMEYMAYALPVVAYRLHETAVAGGDCLVYVPPGDVHAFASAVMELLDDDERRAGLGAAARRRAESVLDWKPQARAYTTVYDELCGHAAPGESPSPQGRTSTAATSDRDQWGNRFIALDDDEGLRHFAAYRKSYRVVQKCP